MGRGIKQVNDSTSYHLWYQKSLLKYHVVEPCMVRRSRSKVWPVQWMQPLSSLELSYPQALGLYKYSGNYAKMPYKVLALRFRGLSLYLSLIEPIPSTVRIHPICRSARLVQTRHANCKVQEASTCQHCYSLKSCFNNLRVYKIPIKIYKLDEKGSNSRV